MHFMILRRHGTSARTAVLVWLAASCLAAQPRFSPHSPAAALSEMGREDLPAPAPSGRR